MTLLFGYQQSKAANTTAAAATGHYGAGAFRAVEVAPTYTGPRKPSPLADDINRLKARVDPLGDAAPEIDLLRVSAQDLNLKFLQPMIQAIQDPQFSTLPLQVRTDALWIYDVTRAYVEHWQHQAPIMVEGAQKIAILNMAENQKAFADAYQALAARVNRNPGMPGPKNMSQKLLQMHANSFRVANQEQPIGYLLDEKHLELAQRKAQIRVAGGSVTEDRINARFAQAVDEQAAPFTFERGTFVEPTTGLELDFPSRDLQLSLETDGNAGHLSATGAHSPVHHYKAQALREQGWHRIAISAASYQSQTQFQPIANGIIKTMAEPAFQEAFAQHNALVAQQQQLRKQIRELRALQADNSNLAPLISLESRIRDLIEERAIERFIRDIPTSCEAYQQLVQLWSKKAQHTAACADANSRIAQVSQSDAQRIAQLGQSLERKTALFEDIVKVYHEYLSPESNVRQPGVSREDWLSHKRDNILKHTNRYSDLVQSLWRSAENIHTLTARQQQSQALETEAQQAIDAFLKGGTVLNNISERMKALATEIQTPTNEADTLIDTLKEQRQALEQFPTGDRYDRPRQYLAQGGVYRDRGRSYDDREERRDSYHVSRDRDYDSRHRHHDHRRDRDEYSRDGDRDRYARDFRDRDRERGHGRSSSSHYR